MAGLPRLTPDAKLAFAEQLAITDKVSGARVQWVPTREQRMAAEASHRHARLYVAKPRQVYMSTWFTFEDVVDTWWADRCGQRMTTGIVIDTDAKATARWEQARDFCEQLSRIIPGDFSFAARRSGGSDPATIEFPNGSKIAAFTAGGNRAGSSLSFQRFHFTEIPYWPRATEAFGSLMPALAREGGRVVIETTVDIKEPLARRLWVEPNGWHKLFLRVEDHESYRADPDSISDDRWHELQAEGYTDRAAAAWFDATIHDEFGGDDVHAYRLYPQKPEHMIQSAAGRFIARTPTVERPRGVLTIEGVSEAYRVEVFRPVEECSGQLVIGVDTAAGKERDHSTIVVVDKRDDAIVGAFASDTIWPDDLGRLAAEVQRAWTLKPEDPIPGLLETRPVAPEAVIEDNGIGAAAWQSFVRHGGQGRAKTMTEPERLAGLLLVKRGVEAGTLYGPAVLADECDELHRDDLGRFAGRKDFCMALGMALRAAELAPYREGWKAPDPAKARMAKRLLSYQKQQKRRASRR